MSPEIIPFPSPEPHLDTPENLQECLDLAEMIDTQIAVWEENSHKPAMHGIGLATFIADDCQPLDHEPQDYTPLTGFGGTLTRKEAKERTAYEKRRAELSQWVQHEELDTLPTRYEAEIQHLREIESYNYDNNPHVSKSFRFSIQSLRRLFILREQLAHKTHRDGQFDAMAYFILINEVIHRPL